MTWHIVSDIQRTVSFHSPPPPPPPPPLSLSLSPPLSVESILSSRFLAMKTTHLLTLSLPPTPNIFCFAHITNRRRHGLQHAKRHRCLRRLRSSSFNFSVSSSLETKPQLQKEPFRALDGSIDSPILLDVSGMMCGTCVCRVKSVLSADERVDSVVVNMVTEMAAVRLKREAAAEKAEVAGSLVRKLTECGFEAKRRLSREGVAENVRKWKDMARKKEELMLKSRNRVAFAWTLVALCCGSHVSHFLHSLGIHFAHGNSTLHLHIYSFPRSL